MPLGAASFREALRMGAEVFHSLKNVLHDRHLSTAVGDEGGFAPNLEEQRRSLGSARHRPSKRPATSSATRSRLPSTRPRPNCTKKRRRRARPATASSRASRTSIASTDEMIDLWKKLCAKWPIRSIEDGLAEDDWAGWQKLTAELGEQGATGRRRSVCHQHTTAARGHRQGGRQQHTHQGQPDRHADRNAGRHRVGPPQRLHQRSSAIAAARPRTRRSPTSRWPPTPARSRPARPAARIGLPSTTNCCGSKKTWEPRHATARSCGRNIAASRLRFGKER